MVEDDGDDQGRPDVLGVLLFLPPIADEQGGGVESARRHVVSDLGLVLGGEPDEGVAGLRAEEGDEVDESGVALAEVCATKLAGSARIAPKREALCEFGRQDGPDELASALRRSQQPLDQGVVGLVSTSRGTFPFSPGTERAFGGGGVDVQGKGRRCGR